MTTVAEPMVWTDQQASSTMPRRRRTGVCPHLRMDGDPVDYARMADAGIAITRSFTGLTGPISTHTFTCPFRPTVHIDAPFVVDRCASSWHKDCEYPYEAEQAQPKREIVMPEPQPEPMFPTITPAQFAALKATIHETIEQRWLSKQGVSLRLGLERDAVSHLLAGRTQRLDVLEALVTYLGIPIQ